MYIEKVEVVSEIDKKEIPDDIYRGVWGGYYITIEIEDNLMYRLKVDTGIRTPAAPCKITIRNGNIEVELK